jgi:hypothetical protein
MEYQSNKSTLATENALDQDGFENEGGTFLSPPVFQLFASSSEDENPGSSASNPELELEIEKHLGTKKGDEGILNVLSILFNESSSTITELWKGSVLNDNLIPFYSQLELTHYLHYPREVAFTLQAIAPEKRREMISEILQKHVGQSEKKADLEKIEAAQVIFLMQGLGTNSVSDPKQNAILSQALKKHAEIAGGLQADVATDNEQMQSQVDLFAGPDSEGLTEVEKSSAAEEKFRTHRAELQLAITTAETKLRGTLKKWGRLGSTSKITPEQAIKAFEILRNLDDEVRSEILRRYPDDVFAVNLNLPQSYRSQIDFGMDAERGLSDKSPAFIAGELAKEETWSSIPHAA